MSLPARLFTHLQRVAYDFNSRLATTDCQGAKYHSPNPLLVEEVDLPSGETVTLCGTCVDNLRVLQAVMDHHDGEAPWPLRREFGNQIRAIAERGHRTKRSH